MSFETELGLRVILLPFAIGSICSAGLARNYKSGALLPKLLLPIQTSIAVVLAGFFNGQSYLPEEYWQRLPWLAAALAVFAVGLSWFEQRTSTSVDVHSHTAFSGTGWVIRSSLLSLAAWQSIPQGEAWDGLSSLDMFWVVMIGLAALWSWRMLEATARVEHSDGETVEAKSENRWHLAIVLAGLLASGGLALQSFASLAEQQFAAASAVGGVILGSCIVRKSMHVNGIRGWAAFQIAASAAQAYFYSYEYIPIPIACYLLVAFSPAIIAGIDKFFLAFAGHQLNRRRREWTRLIIAAVSSAILLGATLAWAVASVPKPEW